MKSTHVLQIALPVPLYKNFDYLAPDHPYAQDIKIGMRVRVSFGQRTLVGIVVGKARCSKLAPGKLKTVDAILDKQSVFDPSLLKILFWAANYYQQPLGEVLLGALPGALRKGKSTALPRSEHYQLCAAENSHRTLARAPKQQEVLALLAAHPEGLGAKEISQHIPNGRSFVNALVAKNLVRKVHRYESGVTPPSDEKIIELSLNKEQHDAHLKILQGLNEFATYLLAGVTGSGKTEVYLEVAKEVLRNNRQVLFLVPEIGLTPQLIQRIKTKLASTVAVMHSNLTETQRTQTWLAASTGLAQIIVGTRSAIFLSCKDLGLIVVDEEHDLSFKQQEGLLYHARDLAIYRAKNLSIPIILGSATPSFESQHNVQSGRYKKLVLNRRALQTQIPQVKVIDLRSKQVMDGLSSELLDAIKVELDKKNQVLLFLNRRGYAPTLLCRNCGWVCECTRCDARMTYYKKQNMVKCHFCLKQLPTPTACPHCNAQDLAGLGEGTQRVETALRELFPTVSITRIDRDSTHKRGVLQTKLEAIHSGEYRIIIGTQMLSKGHDFPGVTLVGILNVDQGLFSTDFRAAERLAQLITQVAGRAGRSTDKGKVLLQTYQPEHPLLNCLLDHGYEAFSKQALSLRQSCGLPPYTFMILLRAHARRQNLAQQFLIDFKRATGISNSSRLKLSGPIPAPMQRKAGMYQSQLVVLCSSRKALYQHSCGWAQSLQQLPLAHRVRWDIEVDPLEME